MVKRMDDTGKYIAAEEGILDARFVRIKVRLEELSEQIEALADAVEILIQLVSREKSKGGVEKD